MSRIILIVLALSIGIACIIGWSFEVPRVDGTVDVGLLIIRAATIGAAVGFVVGLGIAFTAKTFLGRFQAIATAVILLTIATPLLAHYTNRTLSADEAVVIELPVKQVTSEYSGRGLTRDALDAGPDAFSIYVETEDGLIRLRQTDGERPEVGATRTLPVLRNPGYWGYPLYALVETEPGDERVPSFE